MPNQAVRTRFAPSPTGYLHIGGARTALFNWLYARRHGGRFVLRIEDTDLERSREELVEPIMASLRWLGILWDEGPGVGGEYGPYLQSRRLDLYREAAGQLLEAGKAYRCYCTPEELAERREEARRQGRAPRYDRRCLRLTGEERAALEEAGRPSAIRLKVPETGTTLVDDMIRGRVEFDNATLDDFVILKSDGTAAYNFAVVIDDHHMRISHVIRGEEHLSNTPKQLLVYEALGWEPPRFAHVPMILAPDRSKLSKRHGAVAVEEFRENGYLPEALVNYLALLGWSPGGDRETFSLEELVELFSLERVQKSAAIYDTEKLTWLNGQYLKEADLDYLADLLIPRLAERGWVKEPVGSGERQWIKEMIAAGRDRVKTVGEMPELFRYFFEEPAEYDAKGARKHFSPEAAAYLRQARERLADVADWTVGGIEGPFRALIEELGIKGGQLIHPTRLALTGRTMGPGLFDVIYLLGRERTLARLDKAADLIEQDRLPVAEA